jgi:hypothetical protein
MIDLKVTPFAFIYHLICYEDLGATPLEDNGDTRFSIFLFDYYQHSFQKKIFVHSQRGRSPLIFVIKNINNLPKRGVALKS